MSPLLWGGPRKPGLHAHSARCPPTVPGLAPSSLVPLGRQQRPPELQLTRTPRPVLAHGSNHSRGWAATGQALERPATLHCIQAGWWPASCFPLPSNHPGLKASQPHAWETTATAREGGVSSAGSKLPVQRQPREKPRAGAAQVWTRGTEAPARDYDMHNSALPSSQCWTEGGCPFLSTREPSPPARAAPSREGGG